MTPLNLNSLRMFNASARHLNFQKAAIELNVTQGAVAQRVRQLEADLGVSLFHRHARGLSLTEAGAAYFTKTHKALQDIEEATRALSAQKNIFRISLPPSFATKWFVPRFRTLADQFSDVEIQTIASETKSNFQEDGVDLAIRIGSPPNDPNILVKKLSPLDLTAVASPGHPATLAPQTLAQLAEYDLLQDGHAHWSRLLQDAKIPPKGRLYSFNQTALAMDAAANGQGIALAPRLLIQSDVKARRLAAIWFAPAEEGKGYYLLIPTRGADLSLTTAISNWIIDAVDAS